MSTFAEWKERTKLLDKIYSRIEAEIACQAAYKAGERQGRKDAEEMAKRAILLSTKMNINK